MAMNYDAVNRPSSRVSRPPGGTSSNIFGTPDAVQASTRNANNSMKSSIFDSAPEPTKASPPSKRKNPASDASNDIFNVEEKENTAGTDGADVPTKETSNTFKSTLLASGESTMQPGSDPLDHKQRRSFTNSRNQSEIFEPLPERTIKSGPFANTFTSSVFGKSEADVPPPSTSTAAVRYNPITGEVVEDAAGDGNAANKKDDEPTPPARNTFQPHQRSHQPPGGRSTFTFG